MQYRINKLSDIKKFHDTLMEIKFPTLVLREGRQIDGRSLLGLISMDLSQPFELEIGGDVSEDVQRRLNKWLVKDK